MTGPPPPSDPVFIAVEEKISCVLNKDGGVENCEVQGSMSLQVRRGAGVADVGGVSGGWVCVEGGTPDGLGTMSVP